MCPRCVTSLFKPPKDPKLVLDILKLHHKIVLDKQQKCLVFFSLDSKIQNSPLLSKNSIISASTSDGNQIICFSGSCRGALLDCGRGSHQETVWGDIRSRNKAAWENATGWDMPPHHSEK